MFKKAICLLLLMFFSFLGGAGAQAQVQLASVEVDLWPEFDQPSMLVIYRLTLSPQTSLPAEVRLRIPAAAGVPNAVAAQQLDGSLTTVPYEQQAAGDWSWLVFQAPTPDIQVEYYDPSLDKNGAARHFEYTWPGDYAVGAFVVEVQQPSGASEMRITPGMANSNPGKDGMTYYRLDVGALAVGQPFEISVDYQKADDQLSSNSLPVEPSGPLDASAVGRMSLSDALPWVLGFLGFALIAGGGLWYWQSGRELVQPARKKRSRRKPAASPVPAGEAEQSGYIHCHQCGKRAQEGDRFCRVCGTQLRTGS
ncbi:MAG: zinc ribbon domain-containing protein [Anaerolineales bacterium]|nr:zinc ribbon domain-containing protein [Anaerolineales bacterium]